MTDNDNDTRTARIAGLRELADFLEANPQLPVPAAYITAYVDADTARAARQGTHGWAKTNYKNAAYYNYRKTFGGLEEYQGVNYYLEVPKSQTCTRVQVGTKHVAAVEAHDEPVYEWDCTATEAHAGEIA